MKFITENPKASLTAIAGAIVAIIVWVLSLFGITVPLEVSAAVGVILMFLLGRFTRITKEQAEYLKENE